MGPSATTIQRLPPVRDRFGRTFKTLRLSLTPDCNLACVYCVDEETGTGRRGAGLSPDEFLARIRRVQDHAALTTVRLTGGEPLLYRPLEALISQLKAAGIPRVSLTTNAYLLRERMPALAAAGLDSLNISLDTLREETFVRISRRPGLARVLGGIDAALATRLPLKLNMTVYRGLNDEEIVPILNFAGERGLVVRYLELMNMGPLFRGAGSALVPQAEILAKIAAEHGDPVPAERSPAATANYWRLPGDQVFGVIANHSTPFCGDCDRLRMDSRGNLYGCLSENRGLALGPEANPDLDRAALVAALDQKQTVRFTGSDLSMKAIGG